MPAAEQSETTEAADDAALLAAVARGSRRAFAALADRHYDAVYRAVWRFTGGHADCEDVTQEAFLKLWTEPALVREPRALKAWLMRVACNRAVDGLRRARPAPLDAVAEPADGRRGAERALLREEAARLVDAAVLALPERQRLALVLAHFEGMGNIGAAAAMGMSVEAVESLLARARRGLKSALAPHWRDLLAEIGEAGS